MQRNIIPWEIPWNKDLNAGVPRNLLRKKYFGIDLLLLQSAALDRGYHSKYWSSAADWNNRGFQIKDALGIPVTHEVLYNAEQVSGKGVEQYLVQSIPLTPNVIDLNYNPGHIVLESSQAKIKHGGSRAFYTYPVGIYPNFTAGDVITLPPPEQFSDPAEYYYAAMHELMHWSETRLNWNYSKFGNSMSEIIAEMGSSYLMADIKLPQRQFTNCKNHMSEWIAEMKKDENWIFEAAMQASKASGYIFSLTSQH
jgi:antirestriction protein ArdC